MANKKEKWDGEILKMNGSWGSSCRKSLTRGALQSWSLVWSSVYLALNAYECLNSWKSMNKCKILFRVLFFFFFWQWLMYFKIFKNSIFLLHFRTDRGIWLPGRVSRLCAQDGLGDRRERGSRKEADFASLSLLVFLKLKSNFCAFIPSALLSFAKRH